jgi:DNA primase
VVTEGIFDAITVMQAGYDAVALGGKTLVNDCKKEFLTRALQYGTIMLMLDGDALAASLKLQTELSYCPALVHVVVLPDFNCDPNSMGVPGMTEFLRETTKSLGLQGGS